MAGTKAAGFRQQAEHRAPIDEYSEHTCTRRLNRLMMGGAFGQAETPIHAPASASAASGRGGKILLRLS